MQHNSGITAEWFMQGVVSASVCVCWSGGGAAAGSVEFWTTGRAAPDVPNPSHKRVQFVGMGRANHVARVAC